MPNRIVI